MKKAYSYIRFSSAEQAKGHSYQRQHDACLKWCQEHDYELAASEEYTFFDSGLSAFRGKHLDDSGQLKRFFDLVENGSIAAGSTLIVESLDRLSRQEVDKALGQFLALLGQGIRIVTLQDQRIYGEPKSQFTDLIISIVMMSRAHEESATKSHRVSAAWTGRKHVLARQELKPKGRSAPLWLTLTDGAYQTIADRVAVIEEIFGLAVSGYGRGVIAKRLNTTGVPSFKGVTWATSSIAKLLSNRALLGEYQPMHKGEASGDPIQDYYPRIITEETFYAAQEAIHLRRVSKSTKQSENFQVFQGIATCSKCFSPMHLVNKGQPPKGRKYLVCAKNRRGLCDQPSARLEYCEEAFKELLVKLDSRSLVMENEGVLAKKLNEVTGKLLHAEQVRDRHMAAAEELAASPSIYAMIQKADKEVQRLSTERDSLQAELSTTRIVDRDEFMSQLRLETYEMRAQANALLKRLKVQISIQGGSEPCLTAYRLRKELRFEFDDPIDAIVQVIRQKDASMVIIPRNEEQRTLFKLHDKDGTDSKSFDEFLSRKLFGGRKVGRKTANEN